MKHDLIVPAVVAGAYVVGRIQQWMRDRQNNEVGYHLSKAYDAMSKKRGKPE
ncbi:hypothetical protein [Streptomyces shenzhenensis]|uniref:hypothetical protein n=1 Tax=Streptomyces shenzhenensis TaxID=943815 RepID=UPI001F429325|nr:hypothetical protein [Streptomyces shenzhenensis]